MKVRFKNKPNITGISTKFNKGSDVGEVIMYFDDFENLGGADSVFISDLEVFISKNSQFLLNRGTIPEWKSVGHWISMSEAFENYDLITDNYNIEFFEPENDEERKRGYRLSGYDLARLKAEELSPQEIKKKSYKEAIKRHSKIRKIFVVYK